MLLIGTNNSGALEPKRGFTLIEVLLALVILTIGMTGVIRAYIVLMDGIEVSHFTVEASYLLKERMAGIEKEAIENFGVFSAAKSGRFKDSHKMFGWEEEASVVKIGPDRSKEEPGEWPEETLSKVRVSVTGLGGSGSGRRLNLYTYMENHPQ